MIRIIRLIVLSVICIFVNATDGYTQINSLPSGRYIKWIGDDTLWPTVTWSSNTKIMSFLGAGCSFSVRLEFTLGDSDDGAPGFLLSERDAPAEIRCNDIWKIHKPGDFMVYILRLEDAKDKKHNVISGFAISSDIPALKGRVYANVP